MKLTLMITGFLSLVSVAALAQKGELNNAKDKYDKYTVERASKFTMTQAKQDIQDAKTSIDKASVNEKTASLPLTFALKGAIYSSLTVDDTVPATSAPNFKIADEALTKAKALDSVKHENKAMIDNSYLNLAQYEFNSGREAYQNKKYDEAYKAFDYYRQVRPDDTTALYVTGLAATNQGSIDAKYYGYAITSYKKLIATNFSKNPVIYKDLSDIYLATKDTTDAFKIISEGVAKYPANNDLRKKEIEIGLQSGKQDQLLSTVDAAIAADPKNAVLYYYDGITYSQIAEAFEAQAKKTKDLSAKAAIMQKVKDNFAKAATQYKKALDINPNDFPTNLNMGYVLLKPAIYDYKAANEIPTNKQKEYDAAVAKSKAEFEIAKPYLLKAVELNPKSVDALNDLKTYYLGTQDVTNANKIQKQIEALPAN